MNVFYYTVLGCLLFTLGGSSQVHQIYSSGPVHTSTITLKDLDSATVVSLINAFGAGNGRIDVNRFKSYILSLAGGSGNLEVSSAVQSLQQKLGGNVNVNTLQLIFSSIVGSDGRIDTQMLDAMAGVLSQIDANSLGGSGHYVYNYVISLDTPINVIFESIDLNSLRLFFQRFVGVGGQFDLNRLIQLILGHVQNGRLDVAAFESDLKAQFGGQIDLSAIINLLLKFQKPDGTLDIDVMKNTLIAVVGNNGSLNDSVVTSTKPLKEVAQNVANTPGFGVGDALTPAPLVIPIDKVTTTNRIQDTTPSYSAVQTSESNLPTDDEPVTDNPIIDDQISNILGNTDRPSITITLQGVTKSSGQLDISLVVNIVDESTDSNGKLDIDVFIGKLTKGKGNSNWLKTLLLKLQRRDGTFDKETFMNILLLLFSGKNGTLDLSILESRKSVRDLLLGLADSTFVVDGKPSQLARQDVRFFLDKVSEGTLKLFLLSFASPNGRISLDLLTGLFKRYFAKNKLDINGLINAREINMSIRGSRELYAFLMSFYEPTGLFNLQLLMTLLYKFTNTRGYIDMRFYRARGVIGSLLIGAVGIVTGALAAAGLFLGGLLNLYVGTLLGIGNFVAGIAGTILG